MAIYDNLSWMTPLVCFLPRGTAVEQEANCNFIFMEEAWTGALPNKKYIWHWIMQEGMGKMKQWVNIQEDKMKNTTLQFFIKHHDVQQQMCLIWAFGWAITHGETTLKQGKRPWWTCSQHKHGISCQLKQYKRYLIEYLYYCSLLSSTMEKLLMLKIGGVIVIIFFAKGDLQAFPFKNMRELRM